MKKILLPFLLTSTLMGCASFPSDYKENSYGTKIQTPEERALQELNNSWTATQPITYIKSATGDTVRNTGELPKELSDKKIELTFDKQSVVSLDELIMALRYQGINVVSRLKETNVVALNLPEYSGNLMGLMEVLAQVHNIAYEYRKGVLFLTETGRYSVTMPQHEGLLKRAVDGIVNLGAVKAGFDLSAGKIFFEAKPDVLADIEDYIQSISSNSAMVSLQVAVLTVGHNRDRSVGFDWASAALSYGRDGFAPAAVADTVLGTLGQVTGTSMGYTFTGNRFSLTAALNAMSKYGAAKTEQNVTIGTLSGLPVKITSGNEIPYVKSIGSSIADGGAVAGSSETDIITSGLSLEVTPQYDNKDQSVITQVSVDLSTLVGFRELSAGATLGTLSQPEIQKITFNNVSRMAAGDTLVVGGLSYDQLSNNYQSMPGLEETMLASSNEKVTRQTIYIVVRPTVVLFTPDADKRNAELALNKNSMKRKPTATATLTDNAVLQDTKAASPNSEVALDSDQGSVHVVPLKESIMPGEELVLAPAPAETKEAAHD